MLRSLLWTELIHRKQWDRLINELRGYSSMQPELARKDMGERLLSQIHYFGSRADALPEWKKYSTIKDSEELWNIWESLPILSKDDLRDRFHPDKLISLGIKGEISSTGGSTGEPTPFIHDAQMLDANTATRLYAWMQMGWKPGMTTICIWGSQRDIGKARQTRTKLSAYRANQYLIDGYSLGEHTIDAVLDILGKNKKVAIYGFTSMLEYLAQGVLKKGCLPPRGRVVTAWNGGEMLFDSQSELFEKAFGVPILNFYGGRELSATACQTKTDKSLKITRPLLFCEVVDERGKRVAPGETGRLVWTSTICRSTPFIRYDIGDVGCYGAEHIDASGIFALKELQGRKAGLWNLPNGKTINCLFWNHLFKEYGEVEQFQAAFMQDSKVELRLKGSTFTPERETELRQILAGFIGDIPVSIRWVDKIPLTSQGKLIQAVQE